MSMKSFAKPVIIFSILACILLAISFFLLCDLEKIDDEGYIVHFDNKIYDPVGELRDFTVRLTRNCSNVISIDSKQEQYQSIKEALSQFTPARSAIPHRILIENEWALASSEFPDAEGGLFLLMKDKSNHYVIVQNWSGSAAPFKEAPVIRSYFLNSVPIAPKNLIQCYD